MDKASAVEIINSGSIRGQFKTKTIKVVFTASLLYVQHLTGLCNASAVCGTQIGRLAA